MTNIKKVRGFSLIELMVAITISLILLIALVQILVQHHANYSTIGAQAQTQNAEVTIGNIVTESVRGAGFYGCSSNSTMQLVASIGSVPSTGSSMQGYDGGASATISTLNPANSTTLSAWTPTLASVFSGLAESGSDVYVQMGMRPGTTATTLTSDALSGAGSLSVLSTSQIASNGFIAISNCAQSSILQNSGSAAASAVTLSTNSALNQGYKAGSVLVPVSQLAYFVGQASGTQSALYQAENISGSWVATPLVPGVTNMRIWYGIGSVGNTTRYMAASQMSSSAWSTVNSIRMAFLLEGGPGSAKVSTNSNSCANQTQWTLLDRTVTVPCDTRLRHVFNLVIALRNAGL